MVSAVTYSASIIIDWAVCLGSSRCWCGTRRWTVGRGAGGVMTWTRRTSRQGLPDIDRHVVQRIVNPPFSSAWSMSGKNYLAGKHLDELLIHQITHLLTQNT